MDNVALLNSAPNRTIALLFRDSPLEPENMAAATIDAQHPAAVVGVRPFLGLDLRESVAQR